jgi:hypothetical protein
LCPVWRMMVVSAAPLRAPWVMNPARRATTQGVYAGAYIAAPVHTAGDRPRGDTRSRRLR